MVAFWVIAGVLASAISAVFVWKFIERITLTHRQTGNEPYLGSGSSLSIDEQFQELHLPASHRERTKKVVLEIAQQEAQKKIKEVKEEVKKQLDEITKRKEEEVRKAETKYHEVSEKYVEVRKSYRQLDIAKKQTEAIVHSVAEGLIVVNNKGETLMMNPAAEKILGAKSKDAAGKSVLADQKDNQLVSFLQDIAGTEEKEITLNSPSDETKKVIRSSSAVIQNEKGETVGMVSVLTDVTKQKELDELKTKFISNVSHELRTPLHAAQESVNLLLDGVVGDVSEKQKDILNLTLRNIQRLSRLINDVLDFSKLEAGKMTVRPSKFQMEDLVTHTVATFDAWAKSKKVLFENQFPDGPLEVEVDYDKITQVLTNLFGNALKFSREGGIITTCVRRSEERSADGQELIEISVKDTGPGIAPEDLKKLFQKFGQGKITAGGTGLGLVISKELVELHGGRIWVESEEGKGAKFIFFIKRRIPAPPGETSV